ncbi:serine hydroxymethyltransferase [Candidatus Micrarchaeota archaeon]|nr:serine hydroxymethyltransferase [Candidatus Micrarchaeota archaeon]
MFIEKADAQIAELIKREKQRQMEGLELIPSENYASPAVMEAMGSILTNKYSEGYPHKRYYGGNEFVDGVEDLARDRAKKLFGVSHANVQPYSGSPANQAIYFALVEPGDTVMGMHLLYGGHLTHGWKVNFSARYYRAVQYPTGQDGYLNYDAIAELADQEKPRLIYCGATAYPREFDFKRFAKIAESVGAYFAADISHVTGLIVAGVHASPFGVADVVMTTTHKTLRGPRGAMILCNGEPSEPLKKPPEKSKKYLPTLIDRAVFPGLQGGPHDHQTAAIAVALKEAMQPEFKVYGAQIVKNAKALAHTLLDHDFTLVTGGTDNHLLLVDLNNKNLSGGEAERALEHVGMYCNKNTIPFDPRKPFDPSGIRIGTPALTSRGMKESDMEKVGMWMADTLAHPADASVRERVRKEVKAFCQDFVIY